MVRLAARKKREGLASSATRIGNVLSRLLTKSLRRAGTMRVFARRSHSLSSRNAAAAAKGPITRLANVSAHKTVNGVPNGTGPATAALAAATPKINTGTVNG